MKTISKAVRLVTVSLGIIICTAAIMPTQAKSPALNMLKATPVGSWQFREDTTTDHKGRKTLTTIKSSMVSEEIRDEKTYYWVEMVMNTYKLKKKGKRKHTGDQMIMKTLMSADALNADPANVMTNLRGLAIESIMQSGDADPMIFRGAGGMAAGLMQMAGTEVNYAFEDLGNETVEVPAGSFIANKITGKGSTTTKIVFKTIYIESESTVWMSADVPFGMVKAMGTSTMNGKASDNDTQLIEFGLTGAVSLITKTPTELPNFPGLFNN